MSATSTAGGSTPSWCRPPARTITDLLAALAEFDGPVVALESDLGSHLPSTRSVPTTGAACARRSSTSSVAAIDRIAALTGPVVRRSGRERLAGLIEGLRADGLEERAALPVPTDHRADRAEAEVLALLDRAAPPTALLAGGLSLLIGTLRALDRRGLSVGRDLALVAWDDGPLAELSHPPIAVVDRDPRGLGAAAATLALKRLGHGGVRYDEPAHSEVRPVRFIKRASCEADRVGERARHGGGIRSAGGLARG